MPKSIVLNNIESIQVVKPVEQVIQQLRELIENKEIGPGDVLPGERVLASRFGIGRGYIREAIKTLELYGVFKSVPGAGTIVSDLGPNCVGSFISNLVQFSIHNYTDLVEIRTLIEPFTAFKTATNATSDELDVIGKICGELGEAIARNEIDLRLECAFHMEIAKASHNIILASTITSILPGLARLISNMDVTDDDRYVHSHDGHIQIYHALLARDAVAAEQAMRDHIAQVGTYFTAGTSKSHQTLSQTKNSGK